MIEKLNTRGMTRSAKSTRETPGTTVRARAGLNREILNAGWSALERMLSCKAVGMVRVTAAFAPRTCRACGVVDADSPHSQASFKCVACAHTQNADLNAARSILASATGASSRRGALPSGIPVTRETDTEALWHYRMQVEAPACMCADTAEKFVFNQRVTNSLARRIPVKAASAGRVSCA